MNSIVVFINEHFKDVLSNNDVIHFLGNGFSGFELRLSDSLVIRIMYEYIDNLYNIELCWVNNKLILSSCDFYKHYIKKNLHKCFLKKVTFKDHLKVLHLYISETSDRLVSYKTYLSFVNSFVSGYHNLHI